MIRLLLPVAAIGVFFALSWATVFVFHPRDPKRFFLGYALLLLIATTVAYRALWRIARIERRARAGVRSAAAVSRLPDDVERVYSVLWGFSGSLMHDLFNEPPLRDRERLNQVV